MSDVKKKRIWAHEPVVTAITVLASLTAIVTFARACATETPTQVLDPCVAVIGQWEWLTSGGTVSVAEGGLLTWRSPPNSEVFGSWTCDAETGQLTLAWATGFEDRLVLSEDGDRLSGTNNAGAPISATRGR